MSPHFAKFFLHARRRLRERYSMDYTESLLRRIQYMIKRGNYRTYRVYSRKHRSLESVDIDGTTLYMIWSWIHNEPVTFLPTSDSPED